MVENTIGGRYQIVSQLGQGGFGTTFLARDRHLPGQPPCVVKQLSPKNTEPGNLLAARRLFEREAEVLYHLGNCDRIPRLFAHFQEATEFYLVQEFIEGKDLSKELTPGKQVSEEQAIALLENLLEVLAIVHQNNVIHRDIKPSNLIRRKPDNKIILIDFGAVKQINTQVVDSHGQTSFTIAIGSPGYMPNEQMAGKPRFSSDIYAAGMVAIQALTGLHPRRLPEDMKTGEILWRDKAKVSAKLADIIDTMVRCDFRQRYPTAEEALSALKDLPVIISPAVGEKAEQSESREDCTLREKAAVLPDSATVTFRRELSVFERISVIQGDITKQQVDAIVNASNTALSGSAGVDRAIQNAGGWELRRACMKLGGCDIGEAKITQGYKLSAKWVIHTAGPAWLGGNSGEDRNLALCYHSCLALAAQYPIRTMAFPGISTGIQQFPIERASKIAVWAVKRFLEKDASIEKVIFMCFDPDTYQCYLDAIAEVQKLGDNKRSREIDWTRLKTLLAAGKWQSADRETWAIMLKVCDREKEGRLLEEDIKNFPCSELRVLDEFWVKYSGGRFGFSVQQRIWQSVWSREKTESEIYRDFGDRVGWRVSENWLPYKDMNFSLLAPIGHLPAGYIISWHEGIGRFFSRLEICKL